MFCLVKELTFCCAIICLFHARIVPLFRDTEDLAGRKSAEALSLSVSNIFSPPVFRSVINFCPQFTSTIFSSLYLYFLVVVVALCLISISNFVEFSAK